MKLNSPEENKQDSENRRVRKLLEKIDAGKGPINQIGNDGMTCPPMSEEKKVMPYKRSGTAKWWITVGGNLSEGVRRAARSLHLLSVPVALPIAVG